MTGISRFEDIEAWKKARILVRQIYQITSAGPFTRDFALRDQIRRAAISIISNIAEGFRRQSDQEFARFLYIARGSAAEVQSQLYVALDTDCLSESRFRDCYEAADEVARLLTGFIRYLKQADN